MRVSTALPTGVAALLFESARARRQLEGRLTALVEGHGYTEAILPILDYLEPYESLLSPASRGELYRFIDRDGEQLALRADFTPMLARLLAPRLASLPLPLRLFYRGDVVRYAENRPGGRRELYQMGVELLGMGGPPAAGDAAEPVTAAAEATVATAAAAAEREVLELFLAALTGGDGPRPSGDPRYAAGMAGAVQAGEAAAATDAAEAPDAPQVVLGLAGCLDSALAAAATATGLPAAELATAVARRERSVVRRAGGVLLAIVEAGVPELPEELGAPAAARLRWLLALREELAGRFPGVRLSVDLAEFARFSRHPDLAAEAGARSYYDGLVFQAYAGAAAVPVGGGGRYGSLFRALGADIDAVGFSLNLDGLLEAGQGAAAAPAIARRGTAGGSGGGPR